MFYERFDAGKFGTPELRRHMIRALDYHRQIFRTIRARPSAPLGDVARNMDEWIVRVYSIARDVDGFVKNPLIVERMKRLSDCAACHTEASMSTGLHFVAYSSIRARMRTRATTNRCALPIHGCAKNPFCTYGV